MSTAYEIYLTFREHNFVNGLGALVYHRGWRPIFFPTLAVPFLALFGGNPVAAAGGVLWTLYVVLEFYIYNLSRMFLPVIRAALCTVVVITLPVIFLFATVFFSELAWTCFSCMWLYHILKSRMFLSTGHSLLAGMSFGLMIMTRPIESLVIAALPLAYFFGRALREHAITFVALILTICLSALTGTLLILSLNFTVLSRPWLLVLCAASVAACYAISFKHAHPTGTILFAGTACITTVGWWAGFMRPLYDWAYTTSFGYMAKVTAPPRHTTASIPAMVAEVFGHYGAAQLFAIPTLAVLASFIGWRRRQNPRAYDNTTDDPNRSCHALANTGIGTLIITALGSLLPIFVLYWLSGTGDPRRAMVGIVFLLIGTISVILRTAGLLSNTAIAFMTVVAVLQMSLLLSTFGLFLPRAPWVGWLGPLPATVFAGRDGNDIVADFLTRTLPKESRVAVYAMSLHSFPHRVYEPSALQLGTIMRGRSVAVGYLWDEGNYDKGLTRLAEAGYGFLLADTWDDPVVRQSHMPYVHFTAALLDICRMHDSRPPGLRPVSTFSLGGRIHWLFEIPKPPIITAQTTVPFSHKDNIGAHSAGARAIASNQQAGFNVSFLNDDTLAPWGSAEGLDDSYAAIMLSRPRAITAVRLVLFSPEHRPHLRDISVVAADSEPSPEQNWIIVRSRIEGSTAFSEKVTVPPNADGSAITIEIDPRDRRASPHKIWGIACFSASRGYRRNYLTAGSGVYIREVQLLAKAAPRPLQNR